MKPLEFIGSSLSDLRTFPVPAKRQVGHELWQVQMGREPTDFRPMRSVGPGCYEIRIHIKGEWRVTYVAKSEQAVYVIHAFQKKSQKTLHGDIELARRRYNQIRKFL